MVFHPPMLYMGYVGFSVAFAFAIAALLGGRLDATWARWSRPWTTLAWCFPHARHRARQRWAYYELGWGGWWFWDPVENASFMPWLVGTALIHSLAVTEKRGTFKAGPCCSRSALLALASRHVPRALGRAHVGACVRHRSARGIFILASWRSSSAARSSLFAWRAPQVGGGGASTRSRARSLLLANNVLLVALRARCCSARSIRSFSTRSTSARSPSARRISTPCSCR
jgi:cytochrome c-type biogenesis protein CcmF